MDNESAINFTVTSDYNDTSNVTTPLTCVNFYSPPSDLGWYEKYRIVIEVFVVSVLCLFGFIGNGLSVAVLYRDQDRKNATTWLLQTLAIVDTLYLATCIFIQTLTCIHNYTNWIPSLVYAFPYIRPVTWVISSCAQTFTVWTVLLVTIDRYVAICKPLNTQLRSIERAKIAVALTAIFAIMYNIPRCFERKIIYMKDPCSDTMVVIANNTQLKENGTYILVYKTIMYFIFRSVGPLLILIYLNIQLILALRLVHRKQKEMKKRTRRGENLTAMLVAVVTVFIICEIPDTVLRVIYAINQHTKTIDVRNLRVVNVLTNMLLTVNSSINFIIYCLIGKKFRSILAKMTQCGPPQPTRSEVSETEPLTMKSTCNQNCIPLQNNGLKNDVQL